MTTAPTLEAERAAPLKVWEYIKMRVDADFAAAGYPRTAAPVAEDVALPSKQSVGDDPEFQDLAGDVYHAGFYNDSIEKPLNALIAYIDGRTAGTAPEKLIEIGNRMATTLEVLACALKNPGTAEGVRRTVEEWRAAAPSPLPPQKEDK